MLLRCLYTILQNKNGEHYRLLRHVDMMRLYNTYITCLRMEQHLLLFLQTQHPQQPPTSQVQHYITQELTISSIQQIR